VIFSTGQELVLPDDDSSELEYTGTAFNGAFVWHCFEVIEIGDDRYGRHRISQEVAGHCQ